jgi:hypothetical protein
MSMVILYRDPRRPDEGGLTMITGQTKAVTMVDQLEQLGIVDKITFIPPRAEHWPT